MKGKIYYPHQRFVHNLHIFLFILDTEYPSTFRLMLDSNQIHLFLSTLYIRNMGTEALLYELLSFVIKVSPTAVASLYDCKTFVNHYEPIVRRRLECSSRNIY